MRPTTTLSITTAKLLPSVVHLLLITAAVSAVPWAGPEPTRVVPKLDDWSPAPTRPPSRVLGELGLFRRQDDGGIGPNTCGFADGNKFSSLTCRRSGYVCATDLPNHVHGCCDSKSLHSCIIFTKCVPYTSLGSLTASEARTGTSDAFIASCTNPSAPECYNWLYVYPNKVTLTEYGCASLAFTSAISRVYNGYPTDTNMGGSLDISITSRNSRSPSTTTSTSDSATNPSSKRASTSTGAIVGGVVGGLAVIVILVFGIVFIFLRNKKRKDTPSKDKTGKDAFLPEMSNGTSTIGAFAGIGPPPPGPPTPGVGGGGVGAVGPAGSTFYSPEDPLFGTLTTTTTTTPGTPLPGYSQPVFQQQAPVEAGGTPIERGAIPKKNALGQPIFEAP